MPFEFLQRRRLAKDPVAAENEYLEFFMTKDDTTNDENEAPVEVG